MRRRGASAPPDLLSGRFYFHSTEKKSLPIFVPPDSSLFASKNSVIPDWAMKQFSKCGLTVVVWLYYMTNTLPSHERWRAQSERR